MASVAPTPDPKNSEPILDDQLASIVIEVRNDPTGRQFVDEKIAPQAKSAGLTCKAWFGVPDDRGQNSIFIKLHASLSRLLREAARTEFPLLLDEEKLMKADIKVNRALEAEGKVSFLLPDDESRVVASDANLAIPSPPRHFWQRHFEPYCYVYGPYVEMPPGESLYKINARTKCICSHTDALKLLLSVIETPVADGGAGLALNFLEQEEHGNIKSWYPVSNDAAVSRLVKRWAFGMAVTPLEAIRESFGERIAFFFAFLYVFGRWLTVPAVVGLGFFINQAVVGKTSVPGLAAFAIFIGVWATLFVEFLKRYQTTVAMRWGMADYETTGT